MTCELKSGSRIGPLSSEKADLSYKINVPVGTSVLFIGINSTETKGNADVYVKFGSVPTLKVYDYKTTSEGCGENIFVRNPKIGTYYVNVVATTPYTNLWISAQCFIEKFDLVTSLKGDIIVNGIAAKPAILEKETGPITSHYRLLHSSDERIMYYYIVVPENGKDLNIKLYPKNLSAKSKAGDADMYLSYIEPPTKTVYDFSSASKGSSNEEITIPNARFGIYFLLVYRSESFTDLFLHPKLVPHVTKADTTNVAVVEKPKEVVKAVPVKVDTAKPIVTPATAAPVPATTAAPVMSGAQRRRLEAKNAARARRIANIQQKKN